MKSKRAVKAQVQPVVRCKHYWLYPYAIIEGRVKNPNEIAVIRYCNDCGKQQLAYASLWRNVPKQYDIEDLIT